MATIKYQGKDVPIVPGQLILDSGMNIFGLHLFMESMEHIPDAIPSPLRFAFEHRGVRIVIDCDPEQTDAEHDDQDSGNG